MLKNTLIIRKNKNKKPILSFFDFSSFRRFGIRHLFLFFLITTKIYLKKIYVCFVFHYFVTNFIFLSIALNTSIVGDSRFPGLFFRLRQLRSHLIWKFASFRDWLRLVKQKSRRAVCSVFVRILFFPFARAQVSFNIG